MTAHQHIAFVTGLRGLAALYVVLSHIWYQIWPALAAPYGYGREPEGVIAWLTGWLYYGHFGVVVFIVLSGFCLMLPVIDNGGVLGGGVRGFLYRRARRILPPYYFAVVFSLLLIYLFIGQKTGSQWDISIPVTFSGLIAHLFLLQDFFGTTQINYVFWSIAVEIQLYLVFPLLVGAWHRIGAYKTALSFCTVIYALIFILEWIGYRDIPPPFLGLCAYFVFGMLGAWLLDRPRKRAIFFDQKHWEILALALVAVVVILCAVWGHSLAERRFVILDTLCALTTVALLLGAGRPDASSWISTVLQSRILLWIGSLSFSLYLTHAPLLQLVWQYAIMPLKIGAATQFGALLIAGVPICLLAAYGFFIVCERPFLNRQKVIVAPAAIGLMLSSLKKGKQRASNEREFSVGHTD